MEDAISKMTDAISKIWNVEKPLGTESILHEIPESDSFLIITVKSSIGEPNLSEWTMNVDLMEKAFCRQNKNYEYAQLEALDTVVEAILNRNKLLGCAFLNDVFKLNIENGTTTSETIVITLKLK